ncbi:MAG: NifU family protein [Methanomassiliicoccales archaeon]|nr:MAG: NifU family protein [Methanomassiliicoccales archaeon]
MRDKVEEVLEKNIRPALRADGGDIELVEVNEEAGEVKVRLQGACAGCPLSQMTSLTVVERILRQEIPEIKKVTTVT